MSAGKYKILRSLDMSGKVTLAKEPDTGRKLVLKELPDDSVSIYRRISELPPQENLMQVLELDGSTAVCSFAAGRSLDELLESGRQFPEEHIRRLVTQLCRAAEHLHLYRIIHRDITPKNIIIDDDLHLTLIDFDIARVFNGTRAQDTTIRGTEGFAPPEQFGFRETGFTADIYSIGTVLKLLLNLCPDCPPSREVLLRKVISRSTRFEPSGRYRKVSSLRRAVSRTRRLIPEITAASAAVLCAGIAAAVLIIHAQQQDALPTSEPEPPATTADSAASNGSVPKALEEYASLGIRTSDMNCPDRITVTTAQNESGAYEDAFDYVFYDDTAVHGSWEYCNTIPTGLLDGRTSLTDITEYRSEFGHVFSALELGDNGECVYTTASGEVMRNMSAWTNGWFIGYFTDGTAAMRMFEYTVDDAELLFIQVKDGDYRNTGQPTELYNVFMRNDGGDNAGTSFSIDAEKLG